MSGFEISAWAGMAVFVLGSVSVFTTQWNRVNRNRERVINLEKAVNEKIPKLIGKFKDEIVSKTNEVENAVSKLEGSFNTFFLMWKEENGKK